jgi:hypothetical protein
VSNGTGIAALNSEFTDALTEVLAENGVGHSLSFLLAASQLPKHSLNGLAF